MAGLSATCAALLSLMWWACDTAAETLTLGQDPLMWMTGPV
jgi:hypothetical protein